jgi:CrcB protein
LRVWYVFLGGALGSVLRYIVSGLIQQLFGTTFPWGTLFVNLTGSFLIGFLWELFEYLPVIPATRSFTFMGILGAYTTFSTYTFETVNLIRDREFAAATFNILTNNLLGIFLCFAGFFLARFVFNLMR